MPDDAESLRERAKLMRRVADYGRRRPNPYLIGLAEHYEKQADELALAGNKPRSAGA
jgi:hypothetical protein